MLQQNGPEDAFFAGNELLLVHSDLAHQRFCSSSSHLYFQVLLAMMACCADEVGPNRNRMKEPIGVLRLNPTKRVKQVCWYED